MPILPEPWVARNLRATRAEPPGRAADDDYRRALYGASLEQFEQLLRAAETVDAAARPLPLFYAISQAGRAIVAAHGDSPDIASHGLAEDRKHTPHDLLQRRIKRVTSDKGDDAFGAVAKATGSPDITGKVEIGAVWAALPETYRVPPASWLPDWRMALWLMKQPGDAPPDKARMQLWSMGGNPHHGPIETLKGRYPTLPPDTEWYGKAESGDLGGPGNWAIVVLWDEEHDLDKIAPTVGTTDANARQLIPTLPGQEAILSPLMTWWLLLFGLSIFARYHPGLWLRALQVDASDSAVPLEAVLDSGLGVLPRLVYDAVLGIPAYGSVLSLTDQSA
jgi:hypothetical protein